MKKKILVTLLAVSCVVSFSACAGNEEKQVESNKTNHTEIAGTENKSDVQDEETTNVDADEDTVKGEEEELSEADKSVLQESKLGYSVMYDATVFKLDATEEKDTYTYNTTESLDAPIYFSVQKYSEMDAQTVAEELAQKCSIELEEFKWDGTVEVTDTYFGADSLETKNIYMEKEVDGVRQILIFYAIPVGEGSLLVEMGSYVGVPETVDAKFEEMLGTFTLKTE